MSDTIATPPGRTVKAKSVMTPTSNQQRKIVRIKDGQKAAQPVKEKHVALLPVRYAIAPREALPTYVYDQGSLKRDLPQVEQASYVLRSLRHGCVYVYADNKLLGFDITPGGNLRAQRTNPAGTDIQIEYGALIVPSRHGEIALAYSTHEWTPRLRQRIEANEENARTSTMQTVSLAAPARDACPLSALASQVEEFAGRAEAYAWSDTPGATRNPDLYARLPDLAEDGQWVIALADPIGITHDLAAMVEHALNEVKVFVSAPDEAPAPSVAEGGSAVASPSLVATPAATPSSANAADTRYRKKLVAETIGRLYERHLKPGTDPDRLARLRLEHWRAEPANRGKREPTLAELRRDVITSPSVAPGADRLIKHVDEAARRQFLTDYDAQLNELTATLEQLRLDRLVWLNTWGTRGNPYILRAAWHTFDLEDKLDWFMYELSFARAIASLGMSPSGSQQAVQGAQADELALIDQWMKTGLDESPVYRALAGHPPLRDAAAQLGEPNPLETAPDRSGATIDGIASIIDDLHRNFPYTLGTEEIVRSMTVYALAKPMQWRGAVADNIDALLARLAGSDDAATAIRTLMARYGQYVTTTKRTLSEYSRLFIEAAGDPPGLKHSIDQLAKAGTLRADGYVAYEVHETSTKRTAILGKGQPNPFRGWGTVGISALAGLLYLVNLKMAVEQMPDEFTYESTANLGSAVAAIGSGVNASLMAFQTATPRALTSLYGRMPAARALGGLYALRLFGYGGAILTGLSLGIQGGKLIGSGDTDAGLWYAASAVAATTGGVALTYASGALAAGASTLLLTPVGWLIVGAVVVVASIKLGYIGDDAKDTPLEYWLDACTFGKRELDSSKPFSALGEELDALGSALYAPVLIESDWSERWGFPHYKAEAKVFLPGYSAGSSRTRFLIDGTSTAPVHDHYESGGRLVELQGYLPKRSDVTGAKFEITYRPSDAIEEPYTLRFRVPETD